MRRVALLGLVGCAPYVTPDDVRDRADPCAWVASHTLSGTLPSATEPCAAGWVITGDEAHDALGGSLASVGDLDGDGLDDLAIGAPDAHGRRGALHVFGAPTLAARVLHASDADHALVGALPGDEAGAAYTSLDSRDGASGRELVIGSPGDDAGGAEAGMVVLVTTEELTRGSRLEVPGMATRLLGSSRYRAGTSLAVIDSVDDDAFEELLIGAPHASILASQSGTVFVAHSSTLAMSEATVLRDEVAAFPYITADASFGASIATFDGVPGDGRRSGFVVGAPQHPNDDWNLWGQVDWGRAWLFGDYTIPPPQTQRPVLEPFSVFAVNLRAETVWAEREEELRWRDDDARIGSVVAVVPDMDGGGMDELVLAGSYDQADDVVAFVVRGEDMVDGLGGIFLIEHRAAVRLVTPRDGRPTVPTIAGVHDLDGDGLGDLLVGDPWVDGDDALDVGRVYVHTSAALFGPDGTGGQRIVAVDDTPTVLSGDAPGARFGASIAEVGDLDGDGVPEIGIGAPGARRGDADEVGRVLVFRGGP